MIPIEIEPDPDDPVGQALPYVWVQVAGHACRALLDTGSARTTLTPPDAAAVQILDGDGTGAFGISGERRVWRTSVGIGERELGPIEVDTYEVGDGRNLLGQDILCQFRCEYRLTERLLRLDGPELSDGAPIFIGEGRHAYLDVSWPQHAVSASGVFDTGASITVIDAAFVEAHAALVTPAGTSLGTDGSGTTMETPMVTLAGPTILGRWFTETIGAVVDLSGANRTVERPMDLILGWPILRQANWAIDHPKRLAALTDS